MPTLIHLNGPPGAGKSTLARRYADEHVGTLNLDIDRVVALVGGWERDFWAALEPARAVAVAMAETHLGAGHDVVMPQLVTSLEQAERFESAAAAAGASYVEIALGVAPAEQAQRFHSAVRRSEVEQHVAGLLASEGGDDVLERIHGHFTDYVAKRPQARHVATDGLGPPATYRAVLAELTALTELTGLTGLTALQQSAPDGS